MVAAAGARLHALGPGTGGDGSAASGPIRPATTHAAIDAVVAVDVQAHEQPHEHQATMAHGERAARARWCRGVRPWFG